MESKNLSKIRTGTFCSASFILISYLVFRTNLPKIPTLFLYNLIIIAAMQSLGFYRGLFFLGASIFLTIIASLGMDFYYVWNVPMFFIVFLIVESQIKKHEYSDFIISTRMEEVRENTNVLREQRKRHKREALLLEKKEARYNLLKDVTSSLSSMLSLDEVTDLLLENALDIVGKSESALLFMVDTQKQELNLVASKTGSGFEKIKTKKGDLLDDWVFKQRRCLLVEDIRKDFRFGGKGPEEYQRSFRSIISCPLIEEKKVTGIVRLEHSRPYNYNSEDLKLLDVLCDLGAASLENARLYGQTLELAIKDGLTGLYLRRFFLDRFKEELSRSLRNDLDFSLLILDIDDFRNYNDKYGHTAGDIALRTISRVLGGFEDSGIVSRYGGEEFAILLPETSNKKAKRIAEDIRSAVKEETIELRRVKTNVTVSIGVATFPEDGKMEDQLILKADERLYQAKREGKDRVHA